MVIMLHPQVWSSLTREAGFLQGSDQARLCCKKFWGVLCTCLLQGFAKLDKHFQPMLEGCRSNRRHWVELSECRSRQEADVEECTKDQGKAASGTDGSSTQPQPVKLPPEPEPKPSRWQWGCCTCGCSISWQRAPTPYLSGKRHTHSHTLLHYQTSTTQFFLYHSLYI